MPKITQAEVALLIASAQTRILWAKSNIRAWRRTIKTRAKRKAQLDAIARIDEKLPAGEMKDSLNNLRERISEYDNFDARDAFKNNRNTIKRMKRIIKKWS